MRVRERGGREEMREKRGGKRDERKFMMQLK